MIIITIIKVKQASNSLSKYELVPKIHWDLRGEGVWHLMEVMSPKEVILKVASKDSLDGKPQEK